MIRFLFLCVLLVGTAVPAVRADDLFALSATGVAGRASVVIPKVGNNNDAARLTYLNYAGDDASSTVIFYTLGNPGTCTQNQDSISNVVTVSSVSGLASNDVVVFIVNSGTLGTGYRRVLLSTNNSSLKVEGTLGFTATTATTFRKATATGFIPVGQATNGIVGNVWNLPLLLDLTGATSPNLNAVTGEYR
jgi:hypothetical protein